MSVKTLGTVIARRRFRIVGTSRTITVAIGKPRRMRGNPDYNCPFRITTPKGSETHQAYGVDAIQALQLALAIIAAHLSATAEGKAGRLVWDGGKAGDLGLPLSVAGRLLPTAAKRRSRPRRRG